TCITDRAETRRQGCCRALYKTLEGRIRGSPGPGEGQVTMHQIQAAPEGVDGCGQRLRSAREAAGLRLEDVAERLKMPVRVVRSLEDEDWSRLGAPVFVRGQLRSYSRLLGLGTATTIEAAKVGPVEPPALVTHNF